LVGNISVAAEDFDDLFTARSMQNFGGPTFQWAILNYGRIINNVRVQDARFQALVNDYVNTVLRAQAEVENAIAAFLGAQRQVADLVRSVGAAERAVELADLQYREGAADYTRVLNTQQFLVSAQDRLVGTQGAVALNLTALYRALGGGWELRQGQDFVSQETQEQMRQRTRWGEMLTTEEEQSEIEAAAHGTEHDRGWWRWRWWWPLW
jgi:outer membrane protein TolC